MKALRIESFGGPETMRLVEIAEPEPKRAEVRVRVEACGLNFSDVMIREGRYLDPTPLPYHMGREFCGVIDKLGEGVEAWRVGQRVVGSCNGGALADFVIARAGGLAPCPEGMAPAEGASFYIQGVTAMHCLTDYARLQAGETALIHAAAGGVGTLALQIAAAIGAKTIGTASTPEKRKLIEGYGARAVDYTGADWVKEVLDATGGRGADVVLESVGGRIFLRSYREALAPFGRMVVFGIASGEIATLSAREILQSNRSLMGYYLGGYIPKHLDRVASAIARLLALMREGKVKPLIGKVFPLAQAAEAMNYLQSRQSVGKVIVAP